MRGGLDETLARMRRREEALRRRAGESTGATDDRSDAPTDQLGMPVSQFGDPGRGDGTSRADAGLGRADAELSRTDAGSGRVDSRNAGPGWVRESGYDAPQRHVLEEAAEALRAIVAAHPGTTVAARIDHDGQAYDLRVAWSGGEVTVSGQPAAPPPSWPMSANTVPGWPASQDSLDADPAARLAELIRRDPSLLTGEQPAG